MDLDNFYKEIKQILQLHSSTPNPALLILLEKIQSEEIEEILKMTRFTILLEIVNRICKLDAELKVKINEVRRERWANHFGTPTITFLLTYDQLLEQADNSLFSEEDPHLLKKITVATGYPSLNIDQKNKVLVDYQSINRIPLPNEERTGYFQKTHNPSGGFTTTPCDLISKTFIHYASELAEKGNVLEVGAAFGAASLPALAKGTTVYCNDIDPSNLAVIWRRYVEKSATPPSPHKTLPVIN